jgi:hypothetical protein
LEVFLGVLEEFGWVNFGFLGDRGFEVVVGWLELEAIILEGGIEGVWDISDIGGDTGVDVRFLSLVTLGGGSF